MILFRIFRLIRQAAIRLTFFTRGGVAYARRVGVTVGEDCRIYSARFGSEPFLISIGSRVTITSGVSFLTHDGSGILATDERGRRFQYRPIRIGDDVFIGVGAILMPGVVIGSRVLIGAGSVVTRSVPDGMVVAGNPARVLGTFEDFKRRALAEWPADTPETRAIPYRERVMLMLNREPRPVMRMPASGKAESE